MARLSAKLGPGTKRGAVTSSFAASSGTLSCKHVTPLSLLSSSTPLGASATELSSFAASSGALSCKHVTWYTVSLPMPPSSAKGSVTSASSSSSTSPHFCFCGDAASSATGVSAASSGKASSAASTSPASSTSLACSSSTSAADCASGTHVTLYSSSAPMPPNMASGSSNSAVSSSSATAATAGACAGSGAFSSATGAGVGASFFSGPGANLAAADVRVPHAGRVVGMTPPRPPPNAGKSAAKLNSFSGCFTGGDAVAAGLVGVATWRNSTLGCGTSAAAGATAGAEASSMQVTL
mmetsp:Transcript_12455/g.34018  ORF Transcript_12455/g.34018 Transcript_12455/m.34018 type:complete len:295 (+) Transcript_12455:63-947(+)